jgi:hypothetical protein
VAVDTYALIDLEEAKDILEIKGHNENVEVERLIDGVTYDVESFIDRKRLTRTYTAERYNGTGLAQLRLRQYPVTSVTSVDFLSGVSTSGLTWDSKDITNLVALDTVQDNEARGTLYWYDTGFPVGILNVRITYVAGYATVPHNIQLAVRGLLAWFRRQQDRHAVGIGSRTFAGQSEVVGVLAARGHSQLATAVP